MASIGAIAARRDEALKRLKESMERVSDRHGFERVQLTEWNRDPAYLEAERLDQLAGWLERFESVWQVGKASGYDLLSDDEVRLIAEHRQIAVMNPPMERDALIQNLQAYDEQKAGAGEAEAQKAQTAEVNPAAEYQQHTVGELKEMAQERNIDLSGMKTKAEIIDAFLAADGVSEDEQAVINGAKEADDDGTPV